MRSAATDSVDMKQQITSRPTSTSARPRASSQPRSVGERGLRDSTGVDQRTWDIRRKDAGDLQSNILRETGTTSTSNSAMKQNSTLHRVDINPRLAAETRRIDKQNVTQNGKYDCRPKNFTESGATQLQKRRVVHVTEV